MLNSGEDFCESSRMARQKGRSAVAAVVGKPIPSAPLAGVRAGIGDSTPVISVIRIGMSFGFHFEQSDSKRKTYGRKW
jgi:hypothetical protein